jgi:hypothetical protein
MVPGLGSKIGTINKAALKTLASAEGSSVNMLKPFLKCIDAPVWNWFTHLEEYTFDKAGVHFGSKTAPGKKLLGIKLLLL